MDYDDYDSGDYVASDDIPAFLETFTDTSTSKPTEPSTSKPPASYVKDTTTRQKTQHIDAQIAEKEARILEYEQDINKLRGLVQLFKHDVQELRRELKQQLSGADKKGKGKAKDVGIDYGHDTGFEWGKALKGQMKRVFGIDNFRLCQEGVCNANMDGRDIVCVMPTGGGKSLTYQLPALLGAGCTLVISPLISLITDQILHLREAGVEAVMLTGSMAKEEKYDAMRRLRLLAEGKLGPREGDAIKLCYFTPEKLANDKSFLGLIQKLYESGNLARFVIDEAHCLSSLGHDFRHDYQKLHILRKQFPRVPIMALSATCPPLVLKDLVKTLGLPPIVDGYNADDEGTVYFTSPLYRKNLHYKILAKPAKSAEMYQLMVDYILEHHPNDTGIVYCFSRKESEIVAQQLKELSQNRIRTGTYHADVAAAQKESLHKAWRNGSVRVVCATIAFGLGIDKGDVRFVIHHSISKSLEGFYQESGRAGRDGKDSDCVLYYRPQDGTNLVSMVATERDGQSKILSMLEFAEDVEQCRKIQFATLNPSETPPHRYFSQSSNLSIASWSTSDSSALQRCGHCDNCLRAQDTIHRRDVTLDTWKILKVATIVNRAGGKVTLSGLADLARGLGGGKFEVNQGKRGKMKCALDLEAECGGKVGIDKIEIEHLLIQLILKKYLDVEYHQTAYKGIVYIVPGQLAPTLVHLSRKDIETNARRKVEMVVAKGASKPRKRTRTAVEKDASGSSVLRKRKRGAGGKGKGREDDDDGDDEEDEIVDEHGEDDDWAVRPAPGPSRNLFSPTTLEAVVDDDEDDEDEDYDWSRSMREDPPRKRHKGRRKSENGFVMIKEGDNEIMVLSSD
ncbi:hypothetical protein K443DRAFT_7692 [Laccaria amethystina LaAM-08-1]|uniref:DNA 3'-5' helicase n=1 Tax=Laccaria amethystina LaAM-08-1 TaxID=1095629 RepID=A0A0C9WQB0_9AGAR|nr:hypothetical protein K443DRAFT_7692 [Laccaria amethystina LaAM-08-1]